MKLDGWRESHYVVMCEFLKYLNSVSDKYVLKGGTSLLMCYGLDRFSEDIDLDGFDRRFLSIVENFMLDIRKRGVDLTYRVGKDTDTVKRVFIHYGGDRPLKIEVSYRRKELNSNEVSVVKSILVYKIPYILSMKLNAFNHRDKIRDLYDITFIYKNYRNLINNNLIFQLRDAVEFKGLEQFDYLIKDQTDELIDNSKLAEDFLGMYYDLGLI